MKNEIFGERLRKLRGKKNQQDIADLLEISRGRYSHYENNHVEPDMLMIKKIAKLHNVTTDYLLGHSNDPDLTEKEQQKIDAGLNLIMNQINQLPEEQREIAKQDLLKRATELRIIHGR